MKTKTLKISAITFLMALVTLGFSSCSGSGQRDQDHGSHQNHGLSQDTEAGNIELAEFQVNGNCSMCKQRIEAAATLVEGVNSAEWNVQTKKIEVAMDPATDLHDVHMAIAKAGHDTDMHKATDEAYNKLHTCCKYERE
jgi:periplasmic mercuric ion binding protein